MKLDEMSKDDKKLIKDFRKKIKEDGLKIKYFIKKYNLPVSFYHELNKYTPFREVSIQAMKDFIKS